MFQWNALGHVAITDTYTHITRIAGDVLDYFHVNSVDPLADGELLISSRNTWAAYLVSETTGAVIWRLGGKHEQLHARPRAPSSRGSTTPSCSPDGTISLFDNEAGPAGGDAVARARHRARHRRAHRDARRAAHLPRQADPRRAARATCSRSPTATSSSAGDRPARSPSSRPAGALTFDMHFAPPTNSYRAFRYPLDDPARDAAGARRRTNRPAARPSSTRAGTARPTSPAGACSRAPRRYAQDGRHLPLAGLRDRDRRAHRRTLRPRAGALSNRRAAAQLACDQTLAPPRGPRRFRVPAAARLSRGPRRLAASDPPGSGWICPRPLGSPLSG